MKTDTYTMSNREVAVALNRFSKKEYKSLLESSESRIERQKNAQELIDYLCEKFKIAKAKVVVTERSQPQRRTAKILGTYTPVRELITIYNKTAVKKQTVSIKTFANTLIHEFMHHYDLTYLNMKETLHTAGFYKRISDLETKLR